MTGMVETNGEIVRLKTVILFYMVFHENRYAPLLSHGRMSSYHYDCGSFGRGQTGFAGEAVKMVGHMGIRK